ncbi:Phosphatidylglycerol/phosphatidylinositol transfer protein [Meristemomyces frigidus]|nr:Phosphatidylglycerol/phosphatidylinositol transfer protein [Meristemomyces frigidus]
MKLLALATSSLLATAVAARATLFGSAPALAPWDDALNVPGANPLQHCKDPKDDILTLTSVDLDPNPPKAGTPLKISAKGTLTQDIEAGAKIHLSVKYGLITIIRQTADLCDTVQKVDLECPLKKDNETALVKEVDLPNQIPPGKYTVLADVVTKDDEKITCLTATVEFKRGGGVVVVGGKGQEVLEGAEEGEWKQGL